MAMDFPASPTVGAIYAPAGGPTYRWDGAVWVPQSGSSGYVPLAGGTMSGNLIISTGWPTLALDATVADTSGQVAYQHNGKTRWTQYTTVAESGANAGSDFTLARHGDDGIYIGAPLVINRKTGLTTFGGDLTIKKADPALYLDKTAVAQNPGIVGSMNGKFRWIILTGNSTAEGGANAGSDFQINRYNDAGAYIGAALIINRKTSDASLSGGLTVAGWGNFGGVITAGGGITGTDVLSSKASSTAAPSHVYFHNPSGVERALIYATEDGTLIFRYGKTTRAMTLGMDGTLRFAGNVVVYADMFQLNNATDGGVRCKYGPNNAVGPNWFNFWWDSALYACVDKLNLGQVAYVSDYRIKKDVAPLGSTWDIVKALNPISYTQAEYSPDSHLERMAEAVSKDEPALGPFIAADDKERWGFIAHELQETIIPTAASATKDAPDAIQSPDPWPVLATLTRTIQEMQERIEALEGV